MKYENYNYTVNEAWDILFDKFNIAENVSAYGFFKLEAKEIKKYKEPRLMSKWDASKQVPNKFKKNKINILPISRTSYILGNFNIYEKLPEFVKQNEDVFHVELPELESIQIEEITSEANAINVLILTKILDHFLETNENHSTFNGRMGTGKFDFKLERTDNSSFIPIHVESAQCEIDGGFENDESVVILEAKNIVNEDFNVRQLYYPYRLWSKKVNKPIRLVFSIYANKVFRLFEYKFDDKNNMSSIKKVKESMYSIEDVNISLEDIIEVYKHTNPKYYDEKDKNDTPFIQADSMDRIISLLENLYQNPQTEIQIAFELMDFTPRQSNYYFNAGKYLGLFEKEKFGDGGKKVKLTKLAFDIYKSPYKQRQLKIIELIFQHKIFNDLFKFVIKYGEIPDKEIIIKKMRELNVCSENVIDRRANSVYSWLQWIIKLTHLS